MPNNRLLAFVTQARGYANRAWFVATVFDGLGLGLLLALLAAFIAAVTKRGDHVRPAWIILLFLILTTVGLVRWRRAKSRWGTTERAARTIASTPEPLAATDRAGVEDDLLLRIDLLGAVELMLDRTETYSPALVAAHLSDVETWLKRRRADPRRALRRPMWSVRARLAITFAVLAMLSSTSPAVLSGLTLFISGIDARPSPPPEPVWASLVVELRDPPHTGRPPRTIPNPSGPLHVVAGTEVRLDLQAHRPAVRGTLIINTDTPRADDPSRSSLVELEGDEQGLHWAGSFTAHAPGSWSITLANPRGRRGGARTSDPARIELERDRSPEIELAPLPRTQREAGEQDTVDIRFSARDDFGVASAEFCYQLPNGTTHRLPIVPPSPNPRSWRAHFEWDLSAIPIESRSEVLYWVEVRDNDPGLGLEPLVDPPGKMTRSGTMQLTVRDDESEHAQNLATIAELRDIAVDLLAARMTTQAFDAPQPEEPPSLVQSHIDQARRILGNASHLLASVARTVDDLSVDRLASERDAAELAAIHERLWTLHQQEQALHEDLPPGQDMLELDLVASALKRMGRHNADEIQGLEDEIIRLDDLVDNLVIQRIETLVARLEATQRKLVDELEQLKAGDQTARARMEQLEMRRREDLRRLSQARAMLQQEVDREFMNTDAFGILEEIAKQEDVSELIRQGQLDAALEQMRADLDEIRQLRDGVQNRLAEGSPGQPGLSEEDRKRVQLLRELSRLQDDVSTVRQQTEALHQAWSNAVEGERSSRRQRERAASVAEGMARRFEDLNDARVGRNGRRGLADARDAMQRLQAAAENEESTTLELLKAAQQLHDGLAQAESDSEAREAEGRSIRTGLRRTDDLVDELKAALPTPDETLSPDQLEALQALKVRQQGIGDRQTNLRNDELAEQLPRPGKAALREASQALDRGTSELGAVRPQSATLEQTKTWDALQRAIDSLRQGAPPPPASGTAGESSTEADRDRALRDALLEAMREGTPDGFDAPVKRYYEELLR